MWKIPKSVVFQSHSSAPYYVLFDTADHISDEIRKTGSFEGAMVDFAERMLGSSSNGCVIDVGANIGSFVIPLAMKFPNLKFHCFEAQRIVSYQLCGSIAMNALSNVYVNNIAVGRRNESMSIRVPDYANERNVGAFSVSEEINRTRGSTTLGMPEMVVQASIDSFEYNDVALMKIDVEGMELDVLMGSVETLAINGYPPIIFEAWCLEFFATQRSLIFEFLRALGYEIQEVGDNNIAQHPKSVRYVKFS